VSRELLANQNVVVENEVDMLKRASPMVDRRWVLTSVSSSLAPSSDSSFRLLTILKLSKGEYVSVPGGQHGMQVRGVSIV
jgi:hypothetical protein